MRLLDAVALVPWRNSGIGLSDSAMAAGAKLNGTAKHSGGADCNIYQAVTWPLDDVRGTTISIPASLLPLPPAIGPDFVQSAGVTGISTSNSYVAGASFRQWEDRANPATCVASYDGVVWVRDGTDWLVENVERCEDAGPRFGESFGPDTWVSGVNDHGLASGRCVRTAPAASVPVYWTRTSPGVWTLTPLETAGYPNASAYGLNTGSGSDADLLFGTVSSNTGWRTTIWHCATSCGADVLPPSGYSSHGPQMINEEGDIAGTVHTTTSTTYPAVWVHDAGQWLLEILGTGPDPAQGWDVQRVGGTALSSLTAVGWQRGRRDTFAWRWKRSGSSWSGQKLDDLDDSSASFEWGRCIDNDGRVLASRGTNFSVLVPSGLLLP